MEIGVLMFPTDLAIRPDELAREAEARGFESLWFPEHTHIPTSRKTPWPGGTDLPDEYRRTHDPFVALMAAAAVTTRLKLGTGISLVAQHDPIVLAKTVASLDYLSDGRFQFGIGYGWNLDEMEHHGVDPKRRRATVREKVLAMKALWTAEEAEFDGEFVSFSPSWSWPKPVQRPHPPVIIGAAGTARTFGHIAEFADGWMPIFGRDDIVSRIPDLHQAFEAAGRDPATAHVGVFGPPAQPEVLDRLAEAGVARAALGLPPKSRDDVLSRLDRHTELLSRYH
jgi:probable F420-dependent oxidoreductase